MKPWERGSYVEIFEYKNGKMVRLSDLQICINEIYRLEKLVKNDRGEGFYNLMQAYRTARHDPVNEYKAVLDWLKNEGVEI